MDAWQTFLGILIFVFAAMITSNVVCDEFDTAKPYMEACAKQELFANVPPLNFTCEDKIAGGYYADVDTGCHIFHLCAPSNLPTLTDHPFCCHPELVFDQRFLVCDRPENVDCPSSVAYYSDQFDGPVKVLEREAETQARSKERQSRGSAESSSLEEDKKKQNQPQQPDRISPPSHDYNRDNSDVSAQLVDSPGKAVTLPPAFRQR